MPVSRCCKQKLLVTSLGKLSDANNELWSGEMSLEMRSYVQDSNNSKAERFCGGISFVVKIAAAAFELCTDFALALVRDHALGRFRIMF